MPDQIDTTNPLQYISLAFAALGRYEREILCDVAQRLLAGQQQYGQFRDNDSRDFKKETYEELLDGIIYSSRQLKRIA